MQSQRYVREKNFSYVTPPEIENNAEAKALYEEIMAKVGESYEQLAEILKNKHVEELKAQGMDEKSALRTAEKAAIEDARFVLPNACNTKMIVTMNARSLHNFFRLRCCNRAQWEIREVACQMLRLVSEVAPVLFSGAGRLVSTAGAAKEKCPVGK